MVIKGQISREGKAFVTDPSDVLLRGNEESWAEVAPTTVMKTFRTAVEDYGSFPALKARRGPSGAIKTWTYTEYASIVDQVAKSLIQLGLKPREVTLIMGFNCPEWLFAAMGTIMAGGLQSGVYASNTVSAVEYQLVHSKAKIVFAEDEKQVAKFVDCRDRSCGELQYIVQWGGKKHDGEDIFTWDEFIKLGDKIPDQTLATIAEATDPGNACAIIYTSGTTGNPKAVMLSHDNIMFVCNRLHILCEMATGKEVVMSYLPLSHIAAQCLDMFSQIEKAGCCFFAPPTVLKDLVGALSTAQPTILFGVPRVWEKIEEKMKIAGRSNTGLKKMIGDWAKMIGTWATDALATKTRYPWGYWLADKLVFSKVRAALGIQHTTRFYTGAAPIKKTTLEYFASLNIPIFELFGMSECSGPETMNTSNAYRLGSCGRPFESRCHELCLKDMDAAKEGEVAFKGRHIMMGYMYNDEATKETIDEDGFLRSGDLGKVDDDGFLYITGRKKELLITAGGENIPPVLIENELKKQLEAVSNAMVIGDHKKYLTVLFTLKTKVDLATGVPTDELDAPAIVDGSDARTISQATKCPVYTKYLEEGITRANANATSNAQRVQYFRVLPQELTEAGGELTPTLKLMRKKATAKWQHVIDEMYPEE